MFRNALYICVSFLISWGVLVSLSVSSARAQHTTAIAEVAVVSPTRISVRGSKATIRIKMRVGFLYCKTAVISVLKDGYLPRSFVQVYLVNKRRLRVSSGRVVNKAIRRVGRRVGRVSTGPFRCNSSIWGKPRLTFYHYTKTVQLTGLVANQTYYLAPCFPPATWRLGRLTAIRCNSVIEIKTQRGWHSPDVQFVSLTAPSQCSAGGRARLRLKLKNAGLGPVTKSFQVWLNWRNDRRGGLGTKQVKKIVVRNKIRAGGVVTIFVPVRFKLSGPHTASIRIDPQTRLASIGELRSNNNVRNIRFSGKANCESGYDLAVSNIRFPPRRNCTQRIRYTLSNKIRSRVPVLGIPIKIETWMDGGAGIIRPLRAPNTLKSRRAITLQFSTRPFPRDRSFRFRVRITVFPNGNPADRNAGNNVTERTFSCGGRL